MFVSCHIRICSHSWKMPGWAGPAPCPLPRLRWRSCRGGWGGGRAGQVLPRGFEQGRGISGKQAASWNGRFFWQVNSAGYCRGWIQQVAMASYSGGSFWRVLSAGYFGTFIWRVFMANEVSGFQREGKQRKREKMYTQWICKLHNDHCM